MTDKTVSEKTVRQKAVSQKAVPQASVPQEALSEEAVSPKAESEKSVSEKTEQALRDVEQEYTQGADFPLRSYVGAMGVYTGMVAGLAGIARATHRPVPKASPWDVVLLAGATHRLSRLIARDPVTSPLRAPFTQLRGTQGPAELKEDVRGSGARKAVGELLTCPFCTGMWISTGLCAGLVFAPGITRLAASGLTALTGSDFLHFLRAKAM